MSLNDISNQFKILINQELDLILLDISKQYKLDYLELKNKYINNDTLIKNSIIEDTTPKKRGRKKKIKEDMIETVEYEYEGKEYLVDNKNVVYEYISGTPFIVGDKLVDGSINFIKKL